MLGPAASAWALGEDVEGRPLTLVRRHTDGGATYAIFREAQTGCSDADELYGLSVEALMTLAAIVGRHR